MAAHKSSFLDKVLGRIGRLDADGVQQVVERLAHERDFLETLLHTIEDGVLVTDAKGRIAYVNHAATRLLGLQPETSTGQPVARVLPDLDWDNISALGQKEGAGVLRLEIRVQYPRTRLLSLLASPLAGHRQQEPVGVAVILHDATEAHQQTVATVESERIHLLTLLAMSVAHEIGNPLNALHIHLQLMERELKKLRAVTASVESTAGTPARGRRRAAAIGDTMTETSARLEKYVAVAKGEIARLDYIVTHFLQAIRITQPRLAPVSLNDIARETLELLQPELDNRGLVVETALAQHLPNGLLDSAQLKQALVNLIKNSMQAMSKGGMLTLATGTWGDGIWVSVADTGIGIPREQLNRLFEPLFTTKQTGSGLGLMIVYRIVRAHEGRIDVESEAGKGTKFRIWLPLPGRGVRLLKAAGASSTDDSANPRPEDAATADQTTRP